MEMPIVLGRGFTDRDNDTAPKVAVINAAAARTCFANSNPLGQRAGNSVQTSGQIEIVGVLRDAKYDSVRDGAPPTIYLP
jgi:putative ABC transport system permease protein